MDITKIQKLKRARPTGLAQNIAKTKYNKNITTKEKSQIYKQRKPKKPLSTTFADRPIHEYNKAHKGYTTRNKKLPTTYYLNTNLQYPTKKLKNSNQTTMKKHIKKNNTHKGQTQTKNINTQYTKLMKPITKHNPHKDYLCYVVTLNPTQDPCQIYYKTTQPHIKIGTKCILSPAQSNYTQNTNT